MTISTKEQALNSLGVYDTKALRELGRQVEFMTVKPGRQLVTAGRFLPTLTIAVAGSVSLTDASGHAVTLEAPAVIGEWAADERRVARITAQADGDVSLLLVDWRFRDAVNAAISGLTSLSADTEIALATAPIPATTRELSGATNQ